MRQSKECYGSPAPPTLDRDRERRREQEIFVHAQAYGHGHGLPLLALNNLIFKQSDTHQRPLGTGH
jgi:hypothetical protein